MPRKTLVVVLLAMIIVAVSVAAAVLFGNKKTPAVVGGDRDEHGCLVAAGYAYDGTVGACIRSFEMTPDIKNAAAFAVAHVGTSYALTVASFNSYEERGAYDIMLERGIERTPITVIIRNGQVQLPPVDKATITGLLSKKLNIDAATIIATIDTYEGDFAKGQIHFTEESGGGLWFAAKTANGWEVADSGNGIMPCTIADGYRFPGDMVPQCIDVTHRLIQRYASSTVTGSH